MTESLHVQDAITQHSLAQERKELVRAAVAKAMAGRGKAPTGSLPNLFIGSHNETKWRESPRHVSLPACDSSACATVSDQELSRILQRTPAWHKARQHAVIASSAALLLGMLEPKTSKELPGYGLRLYATEGHTRLLQALAEMRSPVQGDSVAGRGAFAACAMDMGTIKEEDVMLTYLRLMDERNEYAPITYALPTPLVYLD